MLLIALVLLNAANPRSNIPEGEQPGQAPAHLSRGERLFKEGDFESALWNFQQANARQPSPAAALGAAECYQRLADKAYAVYFYRTYLRRAPNATDGLEIAERIGELLFSEIENGRGLLEVESAVPAKGSIDGRFLNALPIAAFLPLGDHEVQVELATGRQRRTVSLKRGKPISSLKLDAPSEITRTSASIEPGLGGGAGPISSASLEPFPGLSPGGNPAPRMGVNPAVGPTSGPSPSPAKLTDGPSWMVIAHAGFDGQISAEKVREIFSGGSIVSLDGQVARAVIAREGSPSRTAFLSGFLRKTDASFQASWVKAMFRGGGARALMELATDEEVVKAVATQPGAIGVVAVGTEAAGVIRVSLR
ncbi:MAG TPA: hypothetical protein VEM39_11735 [Myxococcaceae bacterium]|nr:hypothetical protein [Myxococcaceae bacterium]